MDPTLENLSSHPLGVLSLNNQLYFNLDLIYKKLDLFITKRFDLQSINGNNRTSFTRNSFNLAEENIEKVPSVETRVPKLIITIAPKY